MLLNSLIVQAVTAVVMFLYYYLVTQTLDLASQNIFFILVSVTALSIMVTDFSFAITNVQSSQTAQDSIENSIGLRNILILTTLVAAFAFWQFNHDKLGLNTSLITLAVFLQLTELISPYFILVVANRGVIAQTAKLLKFSMTLAILLTIEVTLSELILITIGMNIITFVGILFYLKLALRLQLFKQILRFSLGSTTRLQVYLRNFIPNLGGLLLGTVIPVFGLQFLNADELNKLVLTDRFVRSFENIFQSILQWNLKQFKQFQSKDIIIYSAALIAAGLVMIVAAPNLIRLLLNVEFDIIDNIHLQFYSTIIFLGPLITMFGTIYFIFSDRTLEYSLIIVILGIASIIWISTINEILSITLGLPFLYTITLLMLLLRRKERSSK